MRGQPGHVVLSEHFLNTVPSSHIATQYFRVTRGSLGSLRRSFQELLPATALVNLFFIGCNTLEVLCNVKHIAALQYTFKKLRMAVIPNASSKSTHRARDLIITPQANRNNLELLQSRAKYILSTIRPVRQRTASRNSWRKQRTI